MEIVETDTLVIGSGMCGSFIGIGLRERGFRVSLVEMNREIGGLAKLLRYYKIKIEELGEEFYPGDYVSYLKNRIMELGIPLYTSTSIIDLLQSNKYFIAIGVNRRGVIEYKARRIIIAVGGRERTQYDLLITGTRPAGVFTGLLALELVDKFHKKIGRKGLVLTNNDLGLEVALRLRESGLVIENVVVPERSYPLSKELLDHLSDSDIDLIENNTVLEIDGLKRVESVLLKDLDKDETWRAKVDTLVISMGFLPSIELLRGLEIKIDYETKAPVLTSRLESSIPNIFICGLAAKPYNDLNMALNDSIRALLH